jgi:hypothetical protein
MAINPPDAESLLKDIPRDRPLAIIMAGHNGSGKSTLWNQRLSQVLRIPLLNADRLMLSILPEPEDGDLANLPSWAKELRDDDVRWQLISQATVTSLVEQVILRKVSFAYETVFSHWRELPDGTVESKIRSHPQVSRCWLYGGSPICRPHQFRTIHSPRSHDRVT